jgi:hypothetical protein
MTEKASSHRHLKGVVSFLTWDLGVPRVSPGKDRKKDRSEVLQKVQDYAQTYEIDVISLQNVDGKFERDLEGYQLVEDPTSLDATGRRQSCLVTFIKQGLIRDSSQPEVSKDVHTVQLKIEDDVRMKIKSINSQCSESRRWQPGDILPPGTHVSLGVLRNEAGELSSFSRYMAPAKISWPTNSSEDPDDERMSGWVYDPDSATSVEQVHVLADSLDLREKPALLAYFLISDIRSEAFEKCKAR